MFGKNLRRLSERYQSISELSRMLGINRTQFNRYLSGESFPRPDVLDRICTFFKVDARILLEPVDQLGTDKSILNGPFLREFHGPSVSHVPPEIFPTGFYRFSRLSFVDTSRFLVGLVYILRDGETTYLRGFESRAAMRQQGLPEDGRTREFRGYVARQEDGIAITVARRNSMTCSFNFLSRVASFDNNYWVGYVSRTMPESSDGMRAVRMVYEYVGRRTKPVLAAARTAGFHTADELQPFHRHYLKVNEPFV